MRVCFVSQRAYSLFDPACDSPFGGAELQMYLLANQLAEDPAYDVHFLVQDFGQPIRQRFGDVTVWRYARPFRSSRLLSPVRWFASAVSTFTMLGRIAPDVVIESPAGFPTAVAAAWAEAGRDRKFIYWLASDDDPDGGISGFLLERRLSLWGMRESDLLIAQNGAQQARLRDELARDSLIVRNAFPMRDRPTVAEKDGAVLWVASSQELKRPDIVLDLAEARPAVKFVMVMPKSDETVFDRVVDRAEGIPNVELIPGAGFDDVERLFERAAIFLNTSHTEGFPNTFVQAAMAGTPVLSLEIDPDGVLEGAGFGACAHGDVEALGRMLDDMLSDDAARASTGAAGIAYAKENHDIAVVIDQLKAAIRTL